MSETGRSGLSRLSRRHRDVLERKKYPAREDINVRGKIIVVALLLASTAGTVLLYQRIAL